MNHLLRGFAGELLKLAHADAPFMVEEGTPYQVNIVPGDMNTLRAEMPVSPVASTIVAGALGPIDTPKETIDAHKFNHWYRNKQ